MNRRQSAPKVSLEHYERYGVAWALNRLGYTCVLWTDGSGWIEVGRDYSPVFIATDEAVLRRWLQGRGELEKPVRLVRMAGMQG